SLVDGEIEELYDLRKDPEELTNLALDATHKRQLKRFRQALVAELQRTDAGMVKTLPAVKAE
ncbi:MAG: sulfatase, partial [Planctomycetaceae bacterium]|nr:sulfatase [Planctomycetaceae bacterium]